MEKYLADFFVEFEYERDDAAYLTEAYGRLVGTEIGRKCLDEAMTIYDRDALCDYDRILSLADDAARESGVLEYTAELIFYLCLTPKLRQRSLEAGLYEECYRGCAFDLRYKLGECKRMHGVRGISTGLWHGKFFRLALYTIGRLQFEIVPFEAEYRRDGITLNPDTRVINIHVPGSGEPLTPEACSSSYLRAKAMLGGEIGMEPCPFICRSWLLFPEQERMLSKDSNVYKFFKSFDVYYFSYYKNRQSLERVFNTMERNPDRLVAATSMQRAYLDHIRSGGKLGCGYGVIWI